jgi:Skp family chaperone for outer membrane proteins
MADSAAGGEPAKKRVNVWMIVAIVAIVLAVIAGYLAFSYKQEVDEWEAAANETVAKLQEAGIELRSAVESGVGGYEQQISDLTEALEAAKTQGGMSAAELEETEQQLADTKAELEATQQELDEVQAELDDANAKLAEVGELVLADGAYVGLVLGARSEPFPAIVFQEGTAWRVAEVATGATIMAGGETLTIEEFSELLQSTNPAHVGLANGTYEVNVNGGLARSIRGPSEQPAS